MKTTNHRESKWEGRSPFSLPGLFYAIGIAGATVLALLILFGLTKGNPDDAPGDNQPGSPAKSTMRPEELRRQIRQQAAKVDELRMALSIKSRKGASTDYPAYEIYRLEQEKIKIETQIAGFREYLGEQLPVYASKIDLPENKVIGIYAAYVESKRTIAGLKANGLGDRHPTVIANERIPEVLKSRLDEAVADLQHELETRLLLTKRQIAVARETFEQAKQRGFVTQDYIQAKREYLAELALLEEMQLKLNHQTIPAGQRSSPSANDVGEVLKNSDE